MKNKIDLFRPIINTAILSFVAISLVVVLFDVILLAYISPIVLISVGYLVYRNHQFNSYANTYLKDVSNIVSTMYDSTLIAFPIPVVICTSTFEIMWINEKFNDTFKSENELFGTLITDLFSEITSESISDGEMVSVTYENKRYSVIVTQNSVNENGGISLYFIDDTELKDNAELYSKIRSAIMFMVIDNCDDIIQNSKENEGRELISRVEYEVRSYIKKYGGLFVRTERDKFTVILPSHALDKIIEGKFSILDTVRNLSDKKEMTATLSIGVSRNNDDMTTLEQAAKQALDMSLGRGGDQASLKTQNGYDFYGGVSKGVEKRTKVKTRIIATALLELIETCDNVIFMGHSFPDLDAFGSSVGLSKCVSEMGKKINIAIRKNRHLVSPLYERLEENGYADIFATPEALMDKVNDKTLLIILDTHIESFLESAELYRACKNIVVIDHHRRMVGYIDNAVIFFHEPYASSASEMVSELIPYLMPATGSLTKMEAEALLAGIMLDTKNFIIKTGVRTFEAAAFLKKNGADTIEVKKLFSANIESYQKRSELVSSAKIYKGCAIVTAKSNTDIKVVSAQAADELLTISGVDASFVLFEDGGQIAFSARSFGKINVQIIMEALGGGGHLTMAGAQIKEITIEKALEMLNEAIDKYHTENTK